MPASGSNVLLVSNDLEVSGIWAFVLQQMGLEATLVTSAEEAMDLAFEEMGRLSRSLSRFDTATAVAQLRRFRSTSSVEDS